MESLTESNATSRESNPTLPEQDASLSSDNPSFDVDAFVHTSTDGFGNAMPESDSGSIDVKALGSIVNMPDTSGKKTYS